MVKKDLQFLKKMEVRSRIGYSITIIICGVCSMLLCPASSVLVDDSKLALNYYQTSCPHAEDIVAKSVIAAFRNNPSTIAGLIRLPFHDCFVNGCDASIMLEETPMGGKVERDAPINLPSINDIYVVDEIKENLEKECPGVVSCADVIQYAARDAVALTGLPHYDVPGGRRDGLESLEKNVAPNMPAASSSVQEMIELFKRKGLNEEDLVVLTGAHSVGSAHCPAFYYREQEKDPHLSPKIGEKMKAVCDKQDFQEMLKGTLPFDSVSPNRMDTIFYDQLLEGEGLLESDQALTFDPRTAKIVERMASPKGRWADDKFIKAMIKLGRVDVKTGDQGEIRKHSRYINAAAYKLRHPKH